LREEEEHKPDPWRNPIERNHMGLHLENEVAVVKTPTIISNNSAYVYIYIYMYIYMHMYIYIYIYIHIGHFLLGMSGYSLVFRLSLLCVCKLNWTPNLFITLPQECRNEWNLNVWCTGCYRADLCFKFDLMSHSNTVYSNNMPHKFFF